MFFSLSPLVPGSPSNIKSLAVDSSSLLISWLPPTDPNGKIVSYTVYSKTMVDGRQETKDLEVKETRVVVGELSLQQPYSFWVTAWTIMGEGSRWEIIIE